MNSAIRNKQRLAWYGGLTALVGLTAYLVFWHLERAERSGYYAMVATSMSRSWHNAFFGAADPSGLLALDKIPGSYLIPALLVRLIGFHNAAVVAPNGVATVIAVVLVAHSGRRLGARLEVSGSADQSGWLRIWTGLLAGLLLVATPILIAVARSNEPESAFFLSMALVTFCATRALETKRLRHLIFTGLAIALAFHQYMIMAWAIWPALAVGWYFGAYGSRVRRLFELAIAGVVSLLASLVWIMAVWLTPTSQRPYIGNTLHNNPWEMVFGYNALGRFGNSGHMAGQRSSGTISFKTFTPPFSGHPSLIRLFYHQVIGQISWFIPVTLLVIAFVMLARKRQPVMESGQFLFLTTWFASAAVMFSAVSGMHQYYTSTLALPMVLLVAVGVVAALHRGQAAWLTGFVLAAALFAVLVTRLNPGYHGWTAWLQLALAFIAATLLLLASARRRALTGASLIATAAVLIGGLAFSPLAWSADAMNHPSFVNPMAGPPDSYTVSLAHHSGTNTALNGGTGRKNSSSTSSRVTKVKISHAKVLNWLATRPHGKYLLVTFGADAAAPYLILPKSLKRHIDVLPVGGFNGADPVPTLAQFKQLVSSHQINYVLMNHFVGDESAFKTWGSRQIKHWVSVNCHKTYTPPDRVTLYYCWAQ